MLVNVVPFEDWLPLFKLINNNFPTIEAVDHMELAV